MIDLFESRVFVPPAYRDLPAADQPRIKHRQASAAEVLRWHSADQEIQREAIARQRAAADEHERDLTGRIVTVRVEDLEPGAEVAVYIVTPGKDLADISAVADDDGIAVAAWVPEVDHTELHSEETIAHHLRLVMACVQGLDGIRANGVELDWRDDEKLCEIFGVSEADAARERILLSMGQGLDGLTCLMELANACAKGLDEDEKKGSSESSSAGGST